MFDAIVCITLPRRPDRWKAFQDRFPADWPFKRVVAFPGIDGQLCPRPSWWTESAGSWGCMRSHHSIIERCLNAGYESVLIFEDDALFPDQFVQDLQTFLQQLPADWQMLYLGGQLLRDSIRPPVRVNEWVYRPYNVNRLHAYAVRGTPMLQALYEHASSRDWFLRHHIDHHFGRLHQLNKYNVYVPRRWLVGQLCGQSDITNETSETNYWNNPEQVAQRPLEPFVALMGVHESGADSLSLALHRLGIHMGDNLGDEAQLTDAQDPALSLICEWATPFPSNKIERPEDEFRDRFEDWIGHHMWRARMCRKVAGAKHPDLCVLGNHLQECCGTLLRVIDIRADVGETVNSLKERVAKIPDIANKDFQANTLQRWLMDGKEKFLAGIPHLSLGRTFWESNPEAAVQRIVDYLSLAPSADQFAHAVAALRPSRS